MRLLRGRVVVVLVAVLGLAPLAARSEGPPDVGDLLIGAARLKGMPSSSADEAARSLRSAGYAIPGLALDKSLTQGDVVSVSRALGLTVSTRTPESPFDREDLNAYFSSLGSELAGGVPGSGGNATDGNPTPPSGVDPRAKGKGKKKGLFKSPSEPL